MSSKQLSAGDFIDARCTKCKLVTNHTIVAMVENLPVRVMCNTCNGTHKYHPPKVPKAPKATKTLRTTSANRPSAATAAKKSATAKQKELLADIEEWQSLSLDADPSKAIPYNMQASFKAGNWVSHPTFGMGVVTEVFKPNKVEILFQEGKKLLRCQL